MRCHMGSLNPPGKGLKLSVSRSTVSAGDTIKVLVTISGFPKSWNPGLSLSLDKYSLYGSYMPSEYDWEVIDNSNKNQFNFFKIKYNNDSIFYWIIKAPSQPGLYRIASSAYFADFTTNPSTQGTKRGDNSLVITVNKRNENTKPVLINA
jgi:hypothetical protein